MIKKILIFLIPIVLVFAYGYKPVDRPNGNSGNNNTGKNNGTIPYRIISNPNQVMVVDSKQLKANQINTWFRNNGSFNRDPSTGNSGFEWPKGSLKFARYASGIWIGALVNDSIRICIAEYDYEYLPGWINSSHVPEGKDDANFKVYNISPNDTTDYPGWRTYGKQQGAYTDSLGNPFLMGSQTQFYSYTDGYPEAHGNNAGSTRPLNAVILQTNWSYAVNGPLSNMAFSEFRIINRGTQDWTNCYIALWTDDDLGTATDDAVGVDTVLSLGFTYNFDNDDGQYGSAPPAVGYDYFRGPIVPSTGDTVKFYSPPGSNNLVVKPDYKQLGVSAFNTYENGTDPANYIQTYYNLQGKKRDGTSWINPITNAATPFVYSGNPETGAGWNSSAGNDVRTIQCAGPITVPAGDTQFVVVAQLIAKGENNLKSVTSLKRLSAAAQRIFDNNFQIPPSPPCPTVKSYAPGNGRIYLSWNDTAEKIVIPNKLSTGTYRFQGYNVYAIRPGTNGADATNRTLIATYDIKDGITNIKDSIFVEQYGTYVYTTVQQGSDNGISRYIVIDKDYINNTFIVSGTPYYFAVTAYMYDPLANLEANVTSKVNESPLTTCLISVTPQTLAPGTSVNYNVGDTLYTNQRDLGVMPIIFQPLDLKTASYVSEYGGSPTIPTWTLKRIINGDSNTLYSNVTDFTGKQDTAKTVDGFLLIHQDVKDSGIIRDPENAVLDTSGKNFYTRMKSWTYEPAGTEWFTGPDTTAVKTAKIITNRQFDSRTLGMSFPTTGSFKNAKSKIFANGGQFIQSGSSPILTGGPLRRIQIVFGQTSKAYRFVPTDTNYTSTPCAPEMVDIPFSAYMAEPFDTTSGELRQVNVGFMDADLDGTWNPDTSKLGGYHFTYIFASVYSATPDPNYLNKNPGLNSPALGFPALDIMYAWLPRVKNVNGTALTWKTGDKLTVTPYRITKSSFVPGRSIKYSWNVEGTQTGNSTLASSEINQIKVFPNPYYGGTSLETDPFNRFIYFSHLPSKCTIYIYTLNGVLVRKLTRETNDPNNSLMQWDLLNSSEIPVASGMYVAYVDCGSLGTKTLKIAIFTPSERIQTF